MASSIDAKASGAVFAADSVNPWRDHTTAVPLVLLPVRVETRWFTTADAQVLDLRVRIFPDAVHVANAATIADGERELIIAYWRARAGAGDSPAVVARWTTLCAELGVARAAWLREQLRPTLAPDGELQFPPPSPPATAPIARALPSRFALALCAGPAVVGSRWGAPIPDQVVVLEHTDFAAAEALGLAMRLPVDRSTAAGLSHLIVFGVRDGDVAADQVLLEGLLRDHAVDRGMALLPHGTWTTPGGAPRPTPRPDDEVAATTDGARVARALGVEPDVMRLAAGATRDSDAVPRAMATATWPATWGYFLESIVGAPISAAARDAGRTLFVDDVRAAGPLPALALGRQPYGILPTTAPSRWRDEAGAQAPLVAALLTLLPRWIQAGAAAPQVPATGDALPALRAILAREEHATRYLLRSAMTFDVAAAAMFGEDLDDARRRQLQAVLATPLVAQLTALGVAVPDLTVIAPLIHGENAREVMLPLVASGEGTAAPAYLSALAAADDPWRFRRGELAGAEPRTLLYALLRHATLLVLGRTADRLAGLPTLDWREADVQPAKTESLWDRMEQPLATHGGRTPRELVQLTDPGAGAEELLAHRAALQVLAAGTRADLEDAARGAIDAASHRLDAWLTAHATRRLRLMRSTAPTGVHLGAYSWLTAPPVPAAPATDGAVEDRGSRGFVLAPSLDHARLAAVLRSAFDARPTSDLAVDLSSARVARSRALFDGLRAGHGLAELLGYEVERVVGDAAEIQALRRQFPLATDGDTDPNRARLDGLAAYQRWRVTPPIGAVAAAAQAVLTLVDAAADLLLAETAYQHVRGNPDRTGATLETVAAGTIVPPRCAVVETPAAADRTRYQVVWSFGASTAGWPGDATRVRAVANPTLNAALAALLAAPGELRATIEHGAGGVTHAEVRAVTDLDLCALDLCALTGATFAGSALEAAFRALVPEAVAPRVTPSPALAAALVIARGFREALARATPWGDAIPADPSWTTDAAAATALLAQLATAVDTSGTARLAAWLGAAVADGGAMRALAAARLTALDGDDAARIRTLSGFPPPRGPLGPLAPSTELAGAAAQVRWLADAARVRAPIAGLELITAMTTMPLAAAAGPAGGVLLVVGAGAATSRALCLDTWTEARPRTVRDGAVALHHDAPRARPPQAILVAVPPEPSAAWTPAALLDVVGETFDLVAARLARPSDVWGPTLPALYLAERLDDTTVSTAMTELAVNLEIRG